MGACAPGRQSPRMGHGRCITKKAKRSDERGAQRAHGVKPHCCHWEHEASGLSGDVTVRWAEEGRTTLATVNAGTESSLL